MIVTCLYEMIRIAYVLNTWLVQCYMYKENIEEITRPSYYLDLLSYMMTSAINLANLTYTIQIHDVKLFIQKLVSFRKKPTTQLASNITSHTVKVNLKIHH